VLFARDHEDRKKLSLPNYVLTKTAGHGAKHRVVDLDIDIGADAVDYK
jgi:hypothetical protein